MRRTLRLRGCPALAGITAGLAVGVWSSARAADDPQADYAAIFGPEERRVLATPATRDDAAFAATLVAKAKSLSDAPELVSFLYQKAYQFGVKDPDGYPAAGEALARLADVHALSDREIRAKRVELYTLQSKRGTSAEQRAAAAQALSDGQLSAASDAVAARNYAEAVKLYKEAVPLAQSVGRWRAEEVTALAREAQARQASVQKAQRLRGRPGGKLTAAALAEVVDVYLGELDDPASAAAVAQGSDDAGLRRGLLLAAKPAAELADDERLEVGLWYRDRAAARPSANAGALLLRAAGHLVGFLDRHDRRDAQRLQASDALADAAKRMARSPRPGLQFGGDRAVIWNTNNGPFNDRGATALNVALVAHGVVVWRADGIRTDSTGDPDARVVVHLPPVPYDRLRIEVVAFRGFGGGLSEVQVYRGDRNVAGGAKCEASGTFNAQLFPASRLTDGIAGSRVSEKGYWLLPNGQTGWAEIVLAVHPAS